MLSSKLQSSSPQTAVSSKLSGMVQSRGLNDVTQANSGGHHTSDNARKEGATEALSERVSELYVEMENERQVGAVVLLGA